MVSGAGQAALYTGRLDVARGVGRWMQTLMAAQPNYPQQLYSVYSRAEGLHTNPNPDDEIRYVMSRDAERDQFFFHPGIAGGFLARLYQATGEGEWLELAKEYMRFAEGASDYLFRLLRAGKVGWAAAVLYTLTGERKYREMAVQVGDNLIAGASRGRLLVSSRKRSAQERHHRRDGSLARRDHSGSRARATIRLRLLVHQYVGKTKMMPTSRHAPDPTQTTSPELALGLNGGRKPRMYVTVAALALPVALGLLAASVEIVTGTRLVDPASLLLLGLLVGLLLASAVSSATTITAAPWQRKTLWSAGAVAAVLLAAWVVSNRLFGLSTGALRPSVLLLAGVGGATFSLGTALWGQRSAALAHCGANAIRRWYAWLRTHADAVCISTSVIVALGFRASIMFRAPAFVIGDSGAYVEAAETIRTAFSFAPLGYIFPPGYSTFVAGVQILLGPDFLAVVAVQHLLGIGTVLLTYAVGRAFLPPLLAFLPALGMAANGYLLMIEHGIYTEALFIPLALLFVLLAVRMLHGDGRRGNASDTQSSGNLWRSSGLSIAVAAGATLGLAALTPVGHPASSYCRMPVATSV